VAWCCIHMTVLRQKNMCESSSCLADINKGQGSVCPSSLQSV
jgi:hypothetical protein